MERLLLPRWYLEARETGRLLAAENDAYMARMDADLAVLRVGTRTIPMQGADPFCGPHGETLGQPTAPVRAVGPSPLAPRTLEANSPCATCGGASCARGGTCAPRWEALNRTVNSTLADRAKPVAPFDAYDTRRAYYNSRNLTLYSVQTK